MQKTLRRHFWAVGAIAITYFLTAKLSLWSLNLGVEASPLWPPAGIAVAVLLWRIRWAWVGIVLGSLCANYAIHAPWSLAISDTVGDTLQALLGAFLLQRSGFRNSMERLRDVLIFVGLVVLAVPLVGATISTTLAYGAGLIGWSQIPRNWETLWIGDGMGVLVLTPLMLNWQINGRVRLQKNWQTARLLLSRCRSRKLDYCSLHRRTLEKLLMLGLLIIVSSLVFYSKIQLAIALYPLEYVSFPFAIWAALRFGLPDAALASFVLSAIAISGTALGRGPFAAMPADAGQEVLLLQAFTGVIAITSLVVAAMKAEGRKAEARILMTDMLIHAIAHDLRTTVIGMLMVLNNLKAQAGEKIAVSRTLVERMSCSGEVQLNKLNSLLEVYRYETAEVTLDRQSASLASVLPNVIIELSAVLEQNQVTLENHISADLPSVWIDRSQIRHVFWHLLSNAVKHNPPGITITLRAEVEGETIRCSVADNGKGIRMAQCDRLFNLKIANLDDRQLMGISLGLYLCQQIISAHGGAIGVNSAPSCGSQFWFVLPLATKSYPG
ncbi:MAG: MASE1 domain-containing protein [Drouetiella hepatica Uher 2000/2452]|jgi:signal transduction histidine kinase|uniref:histidine kinase n=1 Tax=Drouetiella hepatica Uher 2000/2452 TaxID=904376 RepID=A0A951QDN9_9CYAN|nr:MASE1 domain-containing protein [Drouetiella hepatica Uher 2000/2452]